MRTLPFALLLAGCGFHVPHQDAVTRGALWDATGIAATIDGLYVPLPAAGGLALVHTDGSYDRVDLGDARVTGLSASADLQTVAVVLERYRCDVDEDELRDIETIAECPNDDLEVMPEIALVVDGEVTATAAVDGPYNQIAWSPTGRWAVAWLDLATLGDIKGVVNLNAIVVMDTTTGASNLVSVGFSASKVLFDEANERVVVLSQGEVAVIDLSTDPPQRDVTFALTLDPDTLVVPVGVELTPDGRYALISVAGAGDLYVLDLETHSVNLLSLAGAPAAMNVVQDADRTVLVYGSQPVVDIVDHTLFDFETIQLDEPMGAIAEAGPHLLLYNPGKRDVYRLDPATGDLVEFRLEGPLASLHVAPTNEFALVFSAENGVGNRPAMEILDLRDDRGRVTTWLLEGRGVGVAFAAGDQTLHALVLQAGTDYLHELDLYAAQGRDVELGAAPLGIGELPDGSGFWITHDAGLGLISFLDPADDEVTQSAGFATLGLADPIGFVAEEEE